MGKRKFIPPIPESVEALQARLIELENLVAIRRDRKTISMQKWRENKRNKNAASSQ